MGQEEGYMKGVKFDDILWISRHEKGIDIL
jgi:hypothetical protein